MNTQLYIGIPYKSHGRDFDGCDCYGLCRLFLKNEMGKDLPEINQYADASAAAEVSNLIINNQPLLSGDRKDIPEVGDVVVIRFKGIASHVGVYVGHGRILHILKGINSMVIPVDHPLIRGKIEGYYGIK